MSTQRVVICTLVYAVAFLFIDLALMLISWPFGPTLFWRLTVYGFFFDLGATALWLGILLIWATLG